MSDDDFVAELVALRKVLARAREVIKDCKGKGIRYPSLIKAVENYDETIWDNAHVK